jgi:hypothetical protein
MRTIILPAGKTQKNLTRLTNWCGFKHDFAGGLHSAKWWGHKIQMRDGSIAINLWPQPTNKGV